MESDLNNVGGRHRRHAARIVPHAIRNSLIVPLGVGAAAGCGFATNILIPHILSPDQTASFFVLTAITTVGGLIGRIGLDRTIVRELSLALAARSYLAVRGFIATNNIAALIITGAVFVVLIAGGWRLLNLAFVKAAPLSTIGAATLVSLLIAFEVSRLIVSEALRGLRAIVAATVLGDAGRATAFFIAIVVVFTWSARVSIESIVLIGAGVSVVTFVLAGLRVAYRVRRLPSADTPVKPEPTLGAFRRLLVGGWPFYVTGLWTFVSNQGDVLVAGALFSPVNTAHYAAASKLTQVLLLPLLALNLHLAPTIGADLRYRAVVAVQRRVRRATSLFAICVIPLAVLFVCMGRDVLGLVFPTPYMAASVVLAVLAIGPLVTAITGPNGFCLVMSGHGPVAAKATTIVSICQLVAMAALGKAFGPVGLAIASTGGTIVLNLIFCYLVHARLGLRTDFSLASIGARTTKDG